MTLELGTHLGPYEIVELLGKGGMGEVYRALDSRLDRNVAIKVLHAGLNESVTFRQRFEREAKTISQFQHPNICTLFDIGSADGVVFLVMEYLEGQTLQERLRQGPLPIDDVQRIGKEIAVAIEAAHRRRIVHRDLKPGNVMLTGTGTKVLDFGLAREVAPPAATVDTQVATMADAITAEGLIAGTIPYMAPEQLEGKAADFRTDIWALGCILHEMATGERPFRGKSQASLITAVMAAPPRAWNREQPATVRKLERIVRRCLEKDPEQRWQSVVEVVVEIESLADRGPEAPDSESGEVACSIAVLPFANMSGDPEQEYFCDGMAEELISALAQLEGLRVVARTSAFQFKTQDLDVREIGDKLGVGSVLEGSVRKSGNRLRVTAQLVNTGDGFEVWSERYDRQLDDVFTIQDDITARIVDALKVELKVGSPSLPAGRRTGNQEAYDLYLRGMHFYWLTTRQGFEKAIECFEGALALDPDYAAAHAGISTASAIQCLLGYLTAEKALSRAEASARRSLELDDSLAQGHHALAQIRAWLRWDWEGAESEFRRAIELNPGLALPHASYATSCLSPLARTQEALIEVRRAHDLDPLSVPINRAVGEALYWDRQYDEAIRQFQHVVGVAPADLPTRDLLVSVYSSNGMLDEAFVERQQIFHRIGRTREADELEVAYSDAGDVGILRWLVERGLPKAERARSEGGGNNRAWNMALVYARLGETDDAFKWLQEAVRQRGGLVTYAKVHPWFDGLRADRRFEDVLNKMGLA